MKLSFTIKTLKSRCWMRTFLKQTKLAGISYPKTKCYKGAFTGVVHYFGGKGVHNKTLYQHTPTQPAKTQWEYNRSNFFCEFLRRGNQEN